jgi:alkanesulfonate monooxygenase SsuD/methylene tetrahydromethanopterin reductase-like flavin-dependent oxidoreductase (luciferase family)
MRIGVLLLPTDPWEVSVKRARHVEALGYHHLWTYDHLSWRRYRDETWHAAMPWLTGMAGATSTIRLGTMVASPNFRHPVTFAKEAMTLDHISGGRLELGIGSGGTGFDAYVLGRENLSATDRTARFTEFVEVLDTLLRTPDSSHRGRFYRVEEARMIPGCVQRPRLPLAIAAAGPKALALAARVGDAWITYGAPDSSDWSPEQIEKEVRRQSDVLAAQCELIGRDPASVRRYYLIGNTQERPLAGLEAFTDFAGRYEALGFTDLVFHDPRPDDPVWTDDPAIVDAIAESQVLSRP